MLTREQMVDTIKGGGSVLVNGRLVSKVENLPSAAALAKTTEEKKAAAKDIDAQIAALRQQKAELDKPPADAGTGTDGTEGTEGNKGGETGQSGQTGQTTDPNAGEGGQQTGQQTGQGGGKPSGGQK